MAPHILPAIPPTVHSRLAEESQNLMSVDRGNIPSCDDDNIKFFVPSGNACQCRSIASCVKSMLFAHHPPFLLLVLFLGLPLLVGGGHPRFRFLLFAMLLMWCEFDCKKLETTGCWENAGATISFTDAIHGRDVGRMLVLGYHSPTPYMQCPVKIMAVVVIEEDFIS